jgi:hypothetical protein
MESTLNKTRDTHLASGTEGEDFSQQDLRARVRRLTEVAANLFNRGSYEVAFDSLMKAYILDSTDPHVIACEKTLLPALEMMRKRGTIQQLEKSSFSSENLQLARHLIEQMQTLAATGTVPRKSGTPAAPATAQTAQQERLENLKHQIELARTEKERAMWREASSPPKIHGKSDASPVKQKSDPIPSADPKHGRGFFAKLRQGRFLG